MRRGALARIYRVRQVRLGFRAQLGQLVERYQDG
jgi:hypothetical protein